MQNFVSVVFLFNHDHSKLDENSSIITDAHTLFLLFLVAELSGSPFTLEESFSNF